MPLTGGEKDIKPPKLIITNPENLTKNFLNDKIIFLFDENISAKNLGNNIFSSPAIPDLKHKIKGNQLELSFDNNKLKELTYLIQLNQTIKDINEGNILNKLEYVFSTKDIIDTLSFSGFAVDAYLDIPMEDIWILLYENNINDSAIFKQQPNFVCKTDSLGFFNFKHLDNLEYKAFAISGLDFKFNNNDKIGFKQSATLEKSLDSIIYLFDPYFSHDSITNLFLESERKNSDTILEKTGKLILNLNKSQDIIIQLSQDNQPKFIGLYNQSECLISDLKVGEYEMRVFLDSNKNGYWDTGSLLNQVQAEKSILYNKKISIRENWDLELNWIIYEL
tara:strand:- start:3008 stop:4012 length:1005 start_codon:yes stop_codon:yes gene_type:complete